jgi:hypothetical protein
MSSHEDLIRRYENGIAVMEDALRDLPEAALDRAPAPGKWTIRQLAAHVADAELVVCGRFRWVAAEPGSPLKAFDQDRWAAALGYERQSPQQALELFRALRRVTAAMLRSLPESAWAHIGCHEQRGELSLETLVESYGGHAEHHARQIQQLRAQFGA